MTFSLSKEKPREKQPRKKIVIPTWISTLFGLILFVTVCMSVVCAPLYWFEFRVTSKAQKIASNIKHHPEQWRVTDRTNGDITFVNSSNNIIVVVNESRPNYSSVHVVHNGETFEAFTRDPDNGAVAKSLMKNVTSKSRIINDIVEGLDTE